MYYSQQLRRPTLKDFVFQNHQLQQVKHFHMLSELFGKSIWEKMEEKLINKYKLKS